MTLTLLIAALVLFGIALVVLIYVMVTERVWIHRIKDLARAGHPLARWYVTIIIVAFALAVAAWISRTADLQREGQGAPAATSASPAASSASSPASAP